MTNGLSPIDRVADNQALRLNFVLRHQPLSYSYWRKEIGSNVGYACSRCIQRIPRKLESTVATAMRSENIIALLNCTGRI